ncbi:MAG: VWA domain-containing protein [Kiritimatiellae bacterium]|nr:VWA domain-containing protein [Kiritimatiellia bacterium]
MKVIKRIVAFMLLSSVSLVGLAAEDRHIVFIHGLSDNGTLWDEMTNLMVRTGFVKRENAVVIDYRDNTSKFPWGGGNTPIEDIGDIVNRQIEGHYFRQGRERPSKHDFIVHSMGGLVLRSMVDTFRIRRNQIGRVVTLATPHYGQDCTSVNTQVNQMDYGSVFMWNLANSEFINGSDVLSVVGVGDRVVDYYAAALNGTHVAYVNKSHCASSNADETAPAICKCGDGEIDIVYRLICAFIGSGTVLNGDRTVPADNSGAILMQIVDAKMNPVVYSSKNIVKSIVGERTGNLSKFNNQSADEPEKAWLSGIVAPARPTTSGWIVKQGGGLAVDSYRFTFNKSKDKVFDEFTTEKSYQVENGRTTVTQIPAENTKPLDFVFLIDSTGSMGSSINSVKNNAKRLIEEKLANGARNCRVAVADYRDYPMSPYGDSGDYVFKLRCGFTTNATAAISALNTISADGGADTPEAVYSALANAIAMDWRPNAVKTIMLMCDAGPHDPEPWAPYYSKSKIIEMAKTLKVDDDDTESGIDDTYAGTKLAKTTSLKAARMVAAKAGESGIIGGVSIYPVLTSSSSSLRATFQDLATETEGKVIDSGSYSSVADAVTEVIEQSVAANGFETEIVTVRETAGSVSVRVFGGSTADAASIGYQVIAGSAVNGKDFTAAEGVQRLTWAEGERSYKTITIPVTEDAGTSNDKFFSIILCNPSGMGLGSINVCRINLLDRNSDGVFRVGDVYVQGLSRNSEMGTVSGSGFCSAGTPRTLTATATSGYVFTSWENGSMASRRSVSAADASSNAVDGVATYVASFIALADLPVPTIESSGVVTGIVGQAVSWGLDYYSMSEATITCAGLPAGFTFADGVISGTPAKSGTSTLTFTARNAKGETSVSMTFVFIRDPSAPYLAEEGNEGEFDAKSGAMTYAGYLLDASGNLAGTILVKAAKANARSGVSKITATVQPMNGRKLTFKGETTDGRSVSVKAGNLTAVLTLGVDGMTGKFGDYAIDGSRNIFASKNSDEKSTANAVLGKWKAINAVWDGGSLSVAIAAKGKAKVAGTLSDGTKVSAKGQLVIGTEWLCIPVVWAKQKANLAFMLWMGKDGNDVMIEGLDNATVGQPAALKGGAAFRMDISALTSILGDSTYGTYLPSGIAVEQKGTKWLVANGAKAGRVQLGKDGNVDAKKAGANASGLKLTYKVKDGTFKGSFKAYANVRGKPTATTVRVTGVMIGDKGYGVATIAKKGSVTVAIE